MGIILTTLGILAEIAGLAFFGFILHSILKNMFSKKFE